MRVKTAILDFFDVRPIPVATRYAVGTLLEGVAVGILLAVVVGLPESVLLVAAGALFAVGAWTAVSAYSALKRQYRIEKRA